MTAGQEHPVGWALVAAPTDEDALHQVRFHFIASSLVRSCTCQPVTGADDDGRPVHWPLARVAAGSTPVEVLLADHRVHVEEAAARGAA